MNKNNQTAPKLAAFHRSDEVTLFFNGQSRIFYLHTIERADGGEFYFVVDFHGWAVDDLTQVAEAVRQIKERA